MLFVYEVHIHKKALTLSQCFQHVLLFCEGSALPDFSSYRIWTIHFVAGLYTKGFVKWFKV